MSRHREGPWFNKTKGTWYYTSNGKNKSLGVRGERNERAAWTAFEAAVAAGDESRDRGPALPAQVEQFLSATAARLKPNTVRIYSLDLRAFAAWEGVRGLTAAAVKPSHVQAWAATLKVADTTRAMSIRSVGAFFGWLVRDGAVEANPVARVKKPRSRKRGREAVMPAATYAALLAAASPGFAAVLRFLRATGCRPGEVGRVTAASYDRSARVVTISEHKTDRDGHDRTIFLDDELAAAVEGLVDRHPTGPVFRTYKGTVWTGRAITEAMKGTCSRAGVKARAYDFRHTWATEALAAGVPDSHVAAMMGHSTPAILHASYSHLTAKARQLSQTAEELRRKRAG